MITKEQKQKIIGDLADKFSRAKAVIFADYSGLSVDSLSQLRNQGRGVDVEFKVAKKTLIGLALQKIKHQDIDVKNMSGQIGLAFGYADVISPAKVLYNFAQGNENLKILGGLIENKKAPLEEILALAKLPSLQELQFQFVSMLGGLVRGLIGVLEGNLRNLVGVLKELTQI